MTGTPEPTDARIRHGYWATLADETERLGKHTITLTTGELRTLLTDAEQAAHEADISNNLAIELLHTQIAWRDTANSLRAEVQRLESLLQQDRTTTTTTTTTRKEAHHDRPARPLPEV